MIFAGLLLGLTNLAWLGVVVFSGGAVFALATLPVELNASARAKRLLAETGIIAGEDEQAGVNSVLNAAALTYVAGLAAALLQLLYFVSLVGRNGRSTPRIGTGATPDTSAEPALAREQRARVCFARTSSDRIGSQRPQRAERSSCYNESLMRKFLIVVLLFLGDHAHHS